MGIGGLLPLLKEIQKPTHAREWAGKTLAVDAYVWLHKGAYGCAEDLALGKPTVKYVNYAMHRVRMLKYFGVTPFLVFDGGLLPSKMGTEDDRERRRTEALAKGRAFLAEGKASQARECFVKAVDVTPAMAYQLIKALQREGVEYVVAPYEADPQLCYLEKEGIVDGIVTEDSDLLVFGCRNVLFKMDGEGNCVSISRDDFSKCREYNLAGWSDAQFRQMAILSGCDYLDSVVGLGLKTAYRLIRKYETPQKVIQFVRLEGQLNVPRNYLDEFRRAELTFLHQHVFDPVKRQLVHLHPLPDEMSLDDLPFIGPLLDEDFARGIAEGTIDPITKEAMVDLVPDAFSPEKAKKAEPFKPGASSSNKAKPKGKAAAEPVKGAGSLLNFFARASPSTSSAAVNPVKAVANQRRVQLVGPSSAKGKGKENEAAVTVKVASKFFGGAAASTKGKERAIEPEPEQEEYEEEDGDEEAEAAMLEVERIEMQVEVRSVIAPQPSSSAGGGISDATNRSPAKPANPTPPTPSRSTFREPSLPSAISSPSTPPPRKRTKLSHTPRPLDQLDEADEVLVSEGGISSPASSARASAGWDRSDSREEHLSSPAPAARPPPRAQPTPVVRVKPEAEEDVKPAARIGGGKKVELSSDPIVLSSDAPEPAVDLAEEEEEEVATPRPAAKKKGKSPRRPKAPARSPEGKGKAAVRRSSGVGSSSGGGEVRAREDAGSSGRKKVKKEGGIKGAPAASSSSASKAKGKGKKRVKEEPEEEEDDEVAEAVKTVAASWRAKFMMGSASRTPQGKPSLGRSLLPTPNTTSRPPSLEKPPAASTARKPSKRATPPAPTSERRLPLSPKSSNRIDRNPSLLSLPKPPSPLKRATSSSQKDRVHDSSSSPAKRRRSSLLADVSASKSQQQQLDPPSSSAGRVEVTNPRLLAFMCKSSIVKRD
ncbi:hypothetical protein JCM8097_007924 [Rhodosporidiobolus ruineniae]